MQDKSKGIYVAVFLSTEQVEHNLHRKIEHLGFVVIT